MPGLGGVGRGSKHAILTDQFPPVYPSLQFQDIRLFSDLSTITFGGTIISDATDVDGNTGSTWNYGSNFGGKAATNPTDHSWPGSWGVADTAYSTYDTDNALTGMNANISMCPGTAGGAGCTG